MSVSKVYASPGQPVATLECRVHGEPFPRVRWQHKTNHQRPDDADPSARLFTYMEGNKWVEKKTQY